MFEPMSRRHGCQAGMIRVPTTKKHAKKDEILVKRKFFFQVGELVRALCLSLGSRSHVMPSSCARVCAV